MENRKESRNEENIIAGRNAVSEALRAGRPLDSLFIRRGEKDPAVLRLVSLAKAAGAAIKEVDVRKLDHMCPGENHQGVVARAALRAYASVEDMLSLAAARGEPPFLLVCDGLEDPHNLGAVIRSAECAGAHGVITPKRRSVGLTYAVGRASAGAVEHMLVARVQNLARELQKLKEKGVWIYAADMDGSPWVQADLTGPCALVVGSEGRGVSRLVKESADFVLSLPVKGKVNSLNASVAAGVLCCEVARQRSGLTAFDPNRKGA